MKRVLTAVVLIPVVLLVVFRAPLWLFALVVAGIVVLALQEYLNIAELSGCKPFQRLSYAMALLLVYVVWAFAARPRAFHSYFSNEWLTPLLLTPVVFGIPLVFRKDLSSGLVSAASSLFGVLYAAGSLALLIALRTTPFQDILVIFALFSVWGGDIAAYYVGRSFGRHRLAPVVSPNKSWEGAIASVVGSVIVGLLVFHFHQQIDGLFAHRWTFYTRITAPRIAISHIVVLSVLTNIAAQFGDLFESALKRGVHLKDSGALLPGHGGILDRIDALLFAIPVVWYYAQLTGFLLPAIH